MLQHLHNMQAASNSGAVLDAKEAYAAAKQTYLEEAQQRFTLPAAQQHELQQVVTTVFQTACRQLEQDHAGLIEVDKENSRVLNNRQVPHVACSCFTCHIHMSYLTMQCMACRPLQLVSWLLLCEVCFVDSQVCAEESCLKT